MKRNDEPDDMLPEYDFRGGVRGKYAERFTRGSNVVVLDPDVAEVFTSSADVNAALRALAGIIRQAGAKAS
jgi:Trm5-related predicted tRNA methylase